MGFQIFWEVSTRRKGNIVDKIVCRVVILWLGMEMKAQRFGSKTPSSYLCAAAHSDGESLRILAEAMMPWDRNEK